MSALEALCDYALYKSTFTLHYMYGGESRDSSISAAACLSSSFYNLCPGQQLLLK